MTASEKPKTTRMITIDVLIMDALPERMFALTVWGSISQPETKRNGAGRSISVGRWSKTAPALYRDASLAIFAPLRETLLSIRNPCAPPPHRDSARRDGVACPLSATAPWRSPPGCPLL